MVVSYYKTRADLARRAATELGKLVSGQDIEAEDQATIDDLIDPLVQQLSIDGVVTIGDTEEIELEYFLPLARLLANEAAQSFGIGKSGEVQAREEAVLRRLTSRKPTYETLKTNYY